LANKVFDVTDARYNHEVAKTCLHFFMFVIRLPLVLCVFNTCLFVWNIVVTQIVAHIKAVGMR